MDSPAAFRTLTTKEKALRINLDTSIYGTFSEIGAGQEVAANFFKAGGSSGTIAQTLSAYDMQISDSLYGECDRYVCEPRLTTMLKHEFDHVTEKLKDREDSLFFAFCDTVEAINYHKTNQGHGWLGIRFMLRPDGSPNECVLHIEMKDNDPVLQQHAIGVLGVNLVYACFFHNDNTDKFLESLMDDLSRDRITIDMFRLTGPDFEDVDNRLMSLRLVKKGMTEAALFGPDGNVLQASEALYKKNILLLRGRFRPVTHVNLDMLGKGLDMFIEEEDVDIANVCLLFELTLKDLSAEGEIDEKDFLDRVDILCSLGHRVMISNYQKYYKLVWYMSRFTRKRKMGLILGIDNLAKIFQDNDQYHLLEGGFLESFGILFGRNIKLMVYPSQNPQTRELTTIDNFPIEDKMAGLFNYLTENGKLSDIHDVNTNLLHIFSDNVLYMIRHGEPGWEEMVPPIVADIIKRKRLFEYKPVPEIVS